MKKILLMLAVTYLTSCGYDATKIETVTVTKPVYINVPQPIQQGMFTCKTYDLSSLTSVTNFVDTTNLTPRSTLSLKSIYNPSVNETTNLSMFTGTTSATLNTKFAIECTAKLKIVDIGSYDLSLYSDDGSELYLNGISVITHGGLHSYTKKTSTVSLDKGTYNLKLRYFQNLGDKGLTLTIKTPVTPFEELLDSSFLE